MLTEYLDAPVVLETSKDVASPHLAKIRGRFLAEGARSGNRRQYVNIGPWIERAQKQLEAGATYDMRTCHEAGDRATEIVGKITKLNADGTYEASIANTPTGQAVLPLIQGGYLKHVSLRAKSATAQPLENEQGWVRITDVEGFAGIDFTNNPGIGQASVAIAESAEGEHVIESFAIGTSTASFLDQLMDLPELHSTTLNLPVEDGWLLAATHFEREYTATERRKAAREGAALPDGSFPIYTAADVRNAARLWAHSPNPAEAKAHIIARAKTLDAVSELPYDWTHDADGRTITAESLTTPTGDAPMPGIADAITSAATTVAETKTPETAPEIAGGSIAEAITSATEANKAPAQPKAVTVEEAIAVLHAAQLPETVREQLAAVLHIAKPATPATPAPAAQATVPATQESLDIKALVESLVEARMTTERQQFEESSKKAVEEAVSQFLAAKRKSIGITETTESGEEPAKMGLGEALGRLLKSNGLSH